MRFGGVAGARAGGVYARHGLDLSVKDILFGVLSCGRLWGREALEAEIVRLCSLEDEGLVCFSVRSGWDLWLEPHGLRAVPVDIDPRTFAPRPRTLEAALTPRTRVVLVAHLFGGRMDLGDVARFAREHDLLLVEDCAQAFQGPESMGDPAADVSMYSFGTLKTSTALGGAVLLVRDREVLARMRGIQASYPLQSRGGYLKKLLEVLGLVAVSRPRPYGLLAGACTRLGSDIDALVNRVVRGFPSGEPAAMFFRRLRQGPSAPLLAMLSRRLRTFDGQRLARRASSAERLASRLRVGDLHPGRHSLQRTHWLFPVVVADPEALILGLRGHGLDASQATSGIAVVEAPPGRSSPAEASLMMSGIVFLPAYPGIPLQAFNVMAVLVND